MCQPNFKQKMSIVIAIAIFFVLIDRLLKQGAKLFWSTRNVSLLGDWFKLVYQTNQGIAFSLPVQSFFAILIIFTILLILAYLFLKKWRLQQMSYTLPLAFIILGAMNNLYDRIAYGSVIDYVYLQWFSVFNLADAMISCGVVCLIIVMTNNSNQY